eukprot:COSAG03_NODE_79_length_14054_cov_53.206951_11_plen_880_part_00
MTVVVSARWDVLLLCFVSFLSESTTSSPAYLQRSAASTTPETDGATGIVGWTRFLQCGEQLCANMSEQVAYIVSLAGDLDTIMPYTGDVWTGYSAPPVRGHSRCYANATHTLPGEITNDASFRFSSTKHNSEGDGSGRYLCVPDADAAVQAWAAPVRAAGIGIMPVIQGANFNNWSAFEGDAGLQFFDTCAAVAHRHGFAGWSLDWEPKPTSSPPSSSGPAEAELEGFARFLTAFASRLQAHGLRLSTAEPNRNLINTTVYGEPYPLNVSGYRSVAQSGAHVLTMSTYYGVMPVSSPDKHFFPKELAAWQRVTPPNRLSIGFGALYPAWNSTQCRSVSVREHRADEASCLALAMAACIAQGIRSVALFQLDAFGWPQSINGKPYPTIRAPWPPASWWPLLRRLRSSAPIERGGGGESGQSHVVQGQRLLTLPVDFAARSGMAAAQRAQGFLHTVFDAQLDGSGTAVNDDSILTPLKMRTYRGREAIGGNAHLGRLGVTNIQLVLSDFWGYGCNNTSGSCAHGVWPPLTKSGLAAPGICCEWPGAGGDWSRLEEVIANVSGWVKDLPVPVSWDIWNEPDSWGIFWHNGGEANYFELWRRAVQIIRKHDPAAQIVGPSFARSYGCDTPVGPCSGGTGPDGQWDPSSPNGTWDGSACAGVPPVTGVPDKLCGLSPLHNTTMRRFLEFGARNKCLPDWLSWHEWSPGLKFLPDHVADVMRYLQATPEVRLRGITINEAFRADDYLRPGGHVAAFANVEAAARLASPLPLTLVKTNMGYGTLDGSVVGSQSASAWNMSASERLRGIYHTHVGYANMSGELLSLPPISPSSSGDGIGIAALASIDNATQTARLLLAVYEDASAKHWTNETHPPTQVPAPHHIEEH